MASTLSWTQEEEEEGGSGKAPMLLAGSVCGAVAVWDPLNAGLHFADAFEKERSAGTLAAASASPPIIKVDKNPLNYLYHYQAHILNTCIRKIRASPYNPYQLATVGEDGNLAVHDLRLPLPIFWTLKLGRLGSQGRAEQG